MAAKPTPHEGYDVISGYFRQIPGLCRAQQPRNGKAAGEVGLFPVAVAAEQGLTSPPQGAGQLAAQKPTADDRDGLDFSGNLLQAFEVLDLKEDLFPFQTSSSRNSIKRFFFLQFLCLK